MEILRRGCATAHIDARRYTFLNSEGSQVTSVPGAGAGDVPGQDLEVRRGDLADALYASVRDDVEFLFGDAIDTLDQSPSGRAGCRGHFPQRATAHVRPGDRRRRDALADPPGPCSRPRSSSTGTSATASPCSPCRTPSGSPRTDDVERPG